MPKRKRPLKSWDQYPQFMTGSLTAAATSTATTTQVALPREKFAHPTSPTVIEILKIIFNVGSNHPNAADEMVKLAVATSDLGSTEASFANSHVIGMHTERLTATGGTPTTTIVLRKDEKEIDFQDNCGYGQIVATDNLFIQVYQTTGSSMTVTYKILYRFVKVGLSEYIGILQSQQ